MLVVFCGGGGVLACADAGFDDADAEAVFEGFEGGFFFLGGGTAFLFFGFGGRGGKGVAVGEGVEGEEEAFFVEPGVAVGAAVHFLVGVVVRVA